MPYYHDEAARAVYAVPNEPTIFPRKGGGWTVSVHIDVDRADNYLDATRHWAKPSLIVHHQEYDARDSREAAVRFFRSRYMTGYGTEVDQKTYESLRAQYDAEAHANKAPDAK